MWMSSSPYRWIGRPLKLVTQAYSIEKDVCYVDKWFKDSREEVCGMVKHLDLIAHSVRQSVLVVTANDKRHLLQPLSLVYVSDSQREIFAESMFPLCCIWLAFWLVAISHVCFIHWECMGWALRSVTSSGLEWLLSRAEVVVFRAHIVIVAWDGEGGFMASAVTWVAFTGAGLGVSMSMSGLPGFGIPRRHPGMSRERWVKMGGT